MAPGEFAESAGEYGSPSRAWLPQTSGDIAGALARRERLLWGLAVVALLADLVTTLVGLQIGLAEGNPLIDSVLHSTGALGFFLVKVAALGVAAAVRLYVPRFRVVIPLGIALPWLLAACINVSLIAIAM